MNENCKIKLILKSKQANTFQTIFTKSPSMSMTNFKRNTSPQLQKLKLLQTQSPRKTSNIRVKMVSEIKKDSSLKKSFKNTKIRQCIIAPCQPDSSQYQYHYTFQQIGSKNFQGLLCQGKKAQYRTRILPTRNLSRQSSEKYSTLSRRPSTSEYLSHKKTGYVELDKFQRKKPWSMNPFHYEGIYMQKLKISLNFYFKVQFANRISIDLSLSSKNHERYKVYVGYGNNQFMIQQILRKRFWYEVVYQPKNCHFYWTQNQMKSIHQQQKSLEINKKCEDQNNFTTESSQNKKNLDKFTLNTKLLSHSDSIKVQNLIDAQGYNFIFPQLTSHIITNHIPGSHILNQRKIIFINLREYYQKYKSKDLWEIIPKTFFINNPTRSEMHFYTDIVLKNKKKLWIIKPGQRQNHQNPIQVLPGAKIMQKLRNLLKYGDKPSTFLLQQYISPFLYKGRKIDFRHFILLTSIGGGIRAYWYYQGYIRTCCKQFSLSNLHPFGHFTTENIQEKCQDFGMYQVGNKLTYHDFQRYLQSCFEDQKHLFQGQILPKMKKNALDLLYANYKKLDPQRKGCNFQIIGLDYILDEELNVYLIGVNTNPSMKSDNPVEGMIIPSIIDQSLWLGLDPFFPPKSHYPAGERLKLGADPLYSLKFQY